MKKNKLRDIEMPRKEEEMMLEDELNLDDLEMEDDMEMEDEEDMEMEDEEAPSILEDVSDEELLNEIKSRGLSVEEDDEESDDMEMEDEEDELDMEL